MVLTIFTSKSFLKVLGGSVPKSTMGWSPGFGVLMVASWFVATGWPSGKALIPVNNWADWLSAYKRLIFSSVFMFCLTSGTGATLLSITPRRTSVCVCVCGLF